MPRDLETIDPPASLMTGAKLRALISEHKILSNPTIRPAAPAWEHTATAMEFLRLCTSYVRPEAAALCNDTNGALRQLRAGLDQVEAAIPALRRWLTPFANHQTSPQAENVRILIDALLSQRDTIELLRRAFFGPYIPDCLRCLDISLPLGWHDVAIGLGGYFLRAVRSCNPDSESKLSGKPVVRFLAEFALEYVTGETQKPDRC
jgi:hypothetical protein